MQQWIYHKIHYIKKEVLPTIKNNSRKEDSEVLTWEVRECLNPGLH